MSTISKSGVNSTRSFHRRTLSAIAGALVWQVCALASAGGEGAALYQQRCAMCHGPEGRGVPGIFPPLAESDFILKERDKALTGPLAGLFGPIQVNGKPYMGGMPPVILADDDLAAVFGFVFSAWGNHANAPTREEIAALRAKTTFPTYEKLLAAMGSAQLPPAPAGWELKVGIDLNFSPVTLFAHPDGEHVLILDLTGDVWIWKPDTAELERIFAGAFYIDPKLGNPGVMGMTVDRNQRLNLVCNQRNDTVNPVRNDVTIFRTEPWTREHPWSTPTPWLQTSYPYGIGPYNHGVSHIAQGPDGKLYVNSGSRTDGGEAGTSPNYAKTGEHHLTSSMWRLNPDDEKPAVEIYARGLRNSFGFCWDDEGHLVATENGPDAHAPEELNVIEQGKHYGFPYQFSDWKTKAYPYTPDPPPGLTFTPPLRNLGPDGGGSPAGLSTFDPHSSPAGIVYLSPDWPAPFGGSFLTARFGNLLAYKQDVGFDILQITPDFTAGTIAVKRVLFPLSRPIDILKWPEHRLIIAEFCHGITLAAGLGTPGRLLVLEPKKR